MNRIIGFLSFICLVLALGCEYKSLEPSYSVVPSVEFRSVKFIAGSMNTIPPVADSLILTFDLRDGDFDLGIADTAAHEPFNEFYFLNKKTRQLVAGNDLPLDITDFAVYRDRKTIDTLPPLSCARWIMWRDTHGIPTDTLYFLSNRNSYNFHMDPYYLNGSQNWSYLDLSRIFDFPYCGYNFPLDGRFDVLKGNSKSGPFNYHAVSSNEGTMTFTFTSFATRQVFLGKKVKFVFSIQDRALHKSNLAETTEIQF